MAQSISVNVSALSIQKYWELIFYIETFINTFTKWQCICKSRLLAMINDNSISLRSVVCCFADKICEANLEYNCNHFAILQKRYIPCHAYYRKIAKIDFCNCNINHCV